MKQEQKAIIEKIQAYGTIIIHRHQSPDPDALGSQVGLAKIIQATYPQKRVYVVGEVSEGLTWMAQMDTVATELYTGALVIVTDTANTPRVSDDRYTKGADLIKIDHHPNDEPYGDPMWVEPAASSSSELIYDLAVAGKMTVPAAAARLLYTGIVGDTGRFMYSATTPHTFEVAAALIKHDFDFTLVNQSLDTMSAEQAHLSAYVLENLIILPSGAAHITLSQEFLKRLGLSVAQTSSIVSLPGKIAAVSAWVIFVEQAPENYRVHFRSKGPIINELAKAHHGGGHPLASGARAQGEAETREIVTALDQIVSHQ
ncbi:DHH family phosphoesterase [Loigolactobacillus backii]|uniref:DHH family phosphoesterase n=1 Tax=Loigolactobacillus backii TaxID=375175 RepID=UPI000C1CBFC4|nr:bifunctional oligoribonuclease/PAP phosphatase NrnA [Loigolactobacillus backii]PIO83083.1 DHH family phosphoesterase [Loigolactobacillus backii]